MDEKKEIKDFVEFTVVKASIKRNMASKLTVQPGNNGIMAFELVKLLKFENGQARFDYSKKMLFSFSNLELAELAINIQKFLSKDGYSNTIVFPHLESSYPKTIYVNFTDKGQLQIKSVAKDSDDHAYNIFLNKNEAYILKQYIDSQINPSLRRMNILMSKFRLFEEDEQDFKEYMNETLRAIYQKLGC